MAFRRPPRRVGGTALAVSLVLALAGCGAVDFAGVTPSPLASTAVTQPTVSPVSEAPGTADAVGPVEDPTLLAVLPAEIDGHAVATEDGQFEEAVLDPDFVANVRSAAFMTVVTAGDLASGVVAELRPGVFSDAFYRDWRASYDDGACAQAGGVARSAEVELSGRTVHITTCAGGLRVYHTYLEDRGILVSLFSLGDGTYGERLMAGVGG